MYAKAFASALAAWGAGREGEETAGRHIATLLPALKEAEAREAIFLTLGEWLATSKAPSATAVMALLRDDAGVSHTARLDVARAMVVTGRTDVDAAGVQLAQLEQVLKNKVPEDAEPAQWHNAQLGVLAAATNDVDVRLKAAAVLRGYSWGAHENRIIAVGSLAAREAYSAAEGMFDTTREGPEGTTLCLVAVATGSFRCGNQQGAAGALERTSEMRGLTELSRNAHVSKASAITLPAGLWATQVCFAERHANGTPRISDAWIKSGSMWSGTVPFPFSATR